MISGYHFVGEALFDGTSIPPNGVWLSTDRETVLCEVGYHCSEHPFDALYYGPYVMPYSELYLCQVDLEGDLKKGGPPMAKCVGQRRRINKRVPMRGHLLRFAADCVLGLEEEITIPQPVRKVLEDLDPSGREEAKQALREFLPTRKYKPNCYNAYAAMWATIHLLNDFSPSSVWHIANVKIRAREDFAEVVTKAFATS